MINANHNSTLSFWTAALALLALILLALPNSDAFSATRQGNVKFDHIRTGFPLTGAHVTLPCETCHIQGAFKGTPKNCQSCHIQGSRIQTTTFKGSNHVVTTQPCSQCHSSTASWSVARFSHIGVTPHQCGQCHNGKTAMGKPANHTPTAAPCDSCHRTSTWMSAGYDHLGVAPGTCATCHKLGGSGLAKPSNHIPSNLSCDTCHTTGGTFSTSRFSHSATQGVVPGQCATCHNGAYTAWNAMGKHAGHAATTASCDTCHVGYASFAGSAAFNHTGVSPGSCATCHTQGGSGMAKPSNHIPTNLSCDACHSTGGTFATSTFKHSATQGVIAGQCSTCHNGAYTAWNALGKSAGHVSTTASCDTCHTGFTSFAGAGFNHTGVAPGSCSTCHVQGGSGMAKPTNHIPTTLSCDACHNTSTFTTSTFTHSATQGIVPGQCSTCHNGAYTTWNALGKPSGHVSTTASCDTCHKGYVSFSGAAFSHTGVAPGTCSTCHYQGGSGLAAPTNHIPYASQLLAGASMNCDSCHKSTTSFTVQTMNHNSSLGNGSGWCKGCHASGTSYLGSMEKKSLTHQSTGVTDCSQSGCHRPLGNRGSPYSSW